MVFFEILGWLFVIWLLGSTIYSIKFHLGNYLLQKQRIKNKVVGELYETLHKQINWKSLILIQVSKLTIAIFLLYLLLK
ncbi:MAG: hypothetical protein CVU77_08780 [Elusimicrobia bacterium HGW-Elusimicrobia-1]|jgi:hypothetical protein|nr:MAG: hypothetical protein CVU77_08780 [Elusimicrobia bacterium HGW-Elusimicrobia-1]